MNEPACKACGKTKSSRSGQWWHLNSYHGFRGFFCPDCFDKVSHDPYGKPNHPQQFKRMKEMLT